MSDLRLPLFFHHGNTVYGNGFSMALGGGGAGTGGINELMLIIAIYCNYCMNGCRIITKITINTIIFVFTTAFAPSIPGYLLLICYMKYIH